jgi:hypothetical protein
MRKNAGSYAPITSPQYAQCDRCMPDIIHQVNVAATAADCEARVGSFV